jgi:hypothetical protein
MAVLPFAFLILLFLPRLVRGEDAPEDRVGLGAGKKELGRLLPLTITNDRLALDSEAWEKQGEKGAAGKEDQGEDQVQIAAGGFVGNAAGIRIAHMGGRNLPTPGKLFQAFMQKAGGGARGASTSMSGTAIHLSQDGQNVSGTLAYDKARAEFALKLIEKTGDGRILCFENDEQTGLTIRFANTATKTSLLLVQSAQGPVSLVSFQGKEATVVSAPDFATLLRQEPSKVQTLFFRPLRALGLEPPLNPYYPPVMAAACTAFSAPAPEIARKAEALIKKLADDDMEVREKATQELSELFPLAIRRLTEAAGKAEDPEVQMRLRKVVASHPGIPKAKAYVEEKKLHEDKAYLTEIFATVPFFRAAARARLAELYGKDYGDDPQAWPEPPAKPAAPAPTPAEKRI